MRVLKLTIQYDGTNYKGWQVQPDTPTVQKAIEEALARLLQEKVGVTAAGRTDAGAHALAQVASFRTESAIGVNDLHRGLNALLPPDVTVLSVEEVAPDYDARFSALGKIYLYRILNRPFRDSLERRYTWHIREKLDLERTREGAGHLIGRHDFSSFRAASCEAATSTREMRRIDIWGRGDTVEVEMEASGFLQHMARIIVGTLVEVGHSRRAPGEIKDILEARDRRRAGITAPARGLFLKQVLY